MNKRFRLLAFSLSIFGVAFFLIFNSCNSSKAMQRNKKLGRMDQKGFVPLFDGKTLNGWEGDKAVWRAENGEIVGEVTASTTPLKANTFLIWRGGTPADFELEAEYRISPGGNSGIQYRSGRVPGVPYGLKGYQLDIDGANQYTGQNYEERERCIVAFRGQKVTLPAVTAPLQSLAKNNVWTASVITGSLGKSDSLKALIHEGWNRCRLIARGNHLQHYINGVLMCDVTDDDITNRASSGLIGLQLHAGRLMKVEFRNIRFKEIK